MSSTKVIVITGASSGIGRGVAIALSKLKEPVRYQLVLGARRESELQAVVAECVANGADATYAVTDITKRDDVKGLLAAGAKAFGRIDILMNNAGRGCDVTPLATTDADIADMMQVNVNSAIYGMQEIIPYFQKNGDETHKA